MSSLLKTVAKAGAGSAVNLAIALARNKVLSVSLGPQGLGMLSLLQQLVATATPVAALGGDAPLVQGIASRNAAERSVFFSSALCALIITWSLTVAIIIVFSPLTVTFLLPAGMPGNQSLLLAALSIPVLATAVSSVFTSTLTAVGAVGSLQKSQMIGNIAGLGAALPLGGFWVSGHTEWFVGYLVAAPLVCTISAFYYIRHLPLASQLIRDLNIRTADRTQLLRFVSFGGVTIVTGFAATCSWFLVRRFVARDFGLDAVGYLTATINLSGITLALLGTALGSFYLPNLASTQAVERSKLVKKILILTVTFASIALVFLQSFSVFTVKLIFSEKFLPMIPLLKLWLIGDFFRAISYVFSFPVLAGAHLRIFLFAELFFAAFLIFGLAAAVRLSPQLSSLGYVYILVYLFYLIVMGYYSKSFGYW